MTERQNCGRILAIDLGTKRVGLAVSDPGRTIAGSLGMIERRGARQDIPRIGQVVREQQATEIVVGLPLHLSGAESQMSRQARNFARLLEEELKLPVRLVDESLTTAAAEEILVEADLSRKKRKKAVDGLAAVMLLESYLRELEERAGRPGE